MKFLFDVKQIIFPVTLLIALGMYSIFLKSPELSTVFGYDDPMHYAYRYGFGVIAGLTAMVLLLRMEREVWFDRLAKGIFFLSLAMFALMIALPHMNQGIAEAVSPRIDGKQYVFKIASVSVVPIYFYLIGAAGSAAGYLRTTPSAATPKHFILAAMAMIVPIMIVLNDMNHLLFSQMVLMALLFHIEGINKLSITVLSVLIATDIGLVLGSDHWMNTLIRWEESLMGTGGSFASGILFENGFLKGSITVIVYAGLIYSLVAQPIKDAGGRLFRDGVVVILSMSLLLNVLAGFGLYPTAPDFLLLIDRGQSTTFAFFIMLGMLFMGTMPEKKEAA